MPVIPLTYPSGLFLLGPTRGNKNWEFVSKGELILAASPQSCHHFSLTFSNLGNSLVKRVLIRFEGFELDPVPALRRARGSLSQSGPSPLTPPLLAEHPCVVGSINRPLRPVRPNSFLVERNQSQHVFLLRASLGEHAVSDSQALKDHRSHASNVYWRASE
jgi:hypothetical protein